VPAQAATLGADALAADVTRDGTIHLGADVQAGGADPVRQITVNGGDIFVDAVLRGADLGAAIQSLSLNAPGGTVFVTGAIDTAGRGSEGEAGGAISITARRIVVTGKLLSSGGAHDALGGAAGAITLKATEEIVVTGVVDASGGNARGAAGVTGGRAADVRLQAGGNVQLQGTARLRGGGATSLGGDAQGGAAATLGVESDAAAHLAGIIDARGGPATADTAGGVVAGGAAGAVRVGEMAPPVSINVLVPLLSPGGDGAAAGGKGGTVTLEAKGGDLHIGTVVDVGGGDSSSLPGAAGVVNGKAGPTAGGIRVSGRIDGVGGSIQPGGLGEGGLGATLVLEVTFLTGGLVVDATGEITLDGGQSADMARAGGGGRMDLFTLDGNVSMGGKLNARGGDARGPIGIGGQGGQVNIFTDKNHDGVGGNLTVETTGVIDVSGGSGTTGGSARNNGGNGVAHFPDLKGEIAVLLNSDGLHGSPQDGQLQNLGQVIARGGPGNGWGGDVIYHGRMWGDSEDPLPGQVDMSAHGSGQPGEYVAE
jgi:hypothetical protein